jgi:hypothetical protein
MKYRVFSSLECSFGSFTETQAEFLHFKDAKAYWDAKVEEYKDKPYFELWEESCIEKGYSFWFECAEASLGMHLMPIEK